MFKHLSPFEQQRAILKHLDDTSEISISVWDSTKSSPLVQLKSTKNGYGNLTSIVFIQSTGMGPG